MLSFLEETLLDIRASTENFSDALLILPSKRAGGFLKHYIRKHSNKPQFLPEILSIEEFIEKLSGLTIIDNTELLFKSYEAYKNTDSISEKDDFETFSSWIPTLLNDLNEIDRYLVPQKEFFSYLSGIQDINHWYVQHEKTELIENYLNFWNGLPEFYDRLVNLLLGENLAYQGLAYRKAAEDIEHYITSINTRVHAFIGFNALNRSEQHIMQELLEHDNTFVYWDGDEQFASDTKHSASLFLRQYVRDWKFYERNEPLGIGNHFHSEKEFEFVETNSQIAQAKYTATVLNTIPKEELSNTAIVLADESLLSPVLHSIPASIDKVNITMGATLRQFPATVLFELLLQLHSKDDTVLYFKNIGAILNHPLASSLVPDAHNILSELAFRNSTHLSFDNLQSIAPKSHHDALELLFAPWEDNSGKAIENCTALLTVLKKNSENSIQRAVLNKLSEVFREVEILNNRFRHFTSVGMVKILFSQLLTTTQLDFQGDAFSGLQIMGVLETRVLDFKNVILLAVNEGILPSGKTNASFITYDLKQAFQLPLYTDKDAIYAYHFYRLLHRAKKVICTYSSKADGLMSGEKSRFLTQLEVSKYPNHKIDQIVLTPSISIPSKEALRIPKTHDVMERIRQIALKGFSPSALTTYVRNPIEFYHKRILRINEMEEVEETVASNTMGTIVHDTLEALYKPFVGHYLNPDELSSLLPKIEPEVIKQFKKTFKSGRFDRGKNLIIFEVVKRYVHNLIQHDLSEIKAGNRIKILRLEEEVSNVISIPQLDFPVHLHGFVDRLDEYNGQIRIIDYKTGFVKQIEMEVMQWEDIISDYKYSKAFQVLAYAEMLHAEMPVEGALSGVISFKNLKSGFLKFGTKDSPKGKRNNPITSEMLNAFRAQLKNLILEICNPDIPFAEKET